MHVRGPGPQPPQAEAVTSYRLTAPDRRGPAPNDAAAYVVAGHSLATSVSTSYVATGSPAALVTSASQRTSP